jgi:WXG100 family type VII secretion target
MADFVRIDYDEVKGVIQRFFDQSDILQQTWDRVNSQMEVLENGAWTGPNADAAYNELDQILIGLNKLVQVMSNCGETLENISKEFKTAEEEASSFFS